MRDVTVELKQLRLHGMAGAWVDLVEQGSHTELDASRWLWFEFGIAADLSGAASIAALRSGHPTFDGCRRICAIVCGAGAEGTA